MEGWKKWAELLASASRVGAHTAHNNGDGRRVLQHLVAGNGHGRAGTEGVSDGGRSAGGEQQDGSQMAQAQNGPGRNAATESKREVLKGGRAHACDPIQ